MNELMKKTKACCALHNSRCVVRDCTVHRRSHVRCHTRLMGSTPVGQADGPRLHVAKWLTHTADFGSSCSFGSCFCCWKSQPSARALATLNCLLLVAPIAAAVSSQRQRGTIPPVLLSSVSRSTLLRARAPLAGWASCLNPGGGNGFIDRKNHTTIACGGGACHSLGALTSWPRTDNQSAPHACILCHS